MTTIVLDAVRLSLPGRPAPGLTERTVTVGPGCRLAVLGRSGSGKTLWTRILLGRLPAPPVEVRGRVLVDGQGWTLPLPGGALDVPSLSRLRGRGIGHVPQGGRENLVPGWTIRRHLLALPSAPTEEQVIPLLLALGLADPERVLGSVATSLSEGMVRRVLLALALAQRPEFVVLDEPTAGLDRVARTATLDLLGERLQGRLGVVLVTHDLDLARLLLGDTGQSVLIEEGCPVSVEAGLGDGDGPLGPLIAAARDLGAWG